MFSSDKKYFIIVIESYSLDSDKYYIEIRARENLSEIVLKHKFSLGDLFNRGSITYFDADLINDSQIVVKSNNFIYTTNINIGAASKSLQINSWLHRYKSNI